MASVLGLGWGSLRLYQEGLEISPNIPNHSSPPCTHCGPLFTPPLQVPKHRPPCPKIISHLFRKRRGSARDPWKHRGLPTVAAQFCCLLCTKMPLPDSIPSGRRRPDPEWRAPLHVDRYFSVCALRNLPGAPSSAQAWAGSRTLLEMQTLNLTNSREPGAWVRVRSGCEQHSRVGGAGFHGHALQCDLSAPSRLHVGTGAGWVRALHSNGADSGP